MAEGDTITAFWSWWPSFVGRLRDGAAPRAVEQDQQLLQQVRAIHPKIQVLGRFNRDHESWLCLSSRGDLALRVVVERWLALASAVPGWRFLGARPRSWPPDRVRTPFPLAELVAAAHLDELREVAHVALHHPGMAELPPVQRTQLAFIALDHLFGEDDVERWIGNLDVSVPPLEPAIPITELRREVEQLSARATGERWQVLRGMRDEAPFLVTINRAIKPLNHLSLDIHARIDMELFAPNRRGLAEKNEAVALDGLQEDLRHDLGTRGVALARETHRGHRIVHMHVDRAAARDLETWRQKHPERPIALLVQNDPSWDVLRRWG